MERQALIDKLDNARNLLSTIRKLPVEVITKMFYQESHIPDIVVVEVAGQEIVKTGEWKIPYFIP